MAERLPTGQALALSVCHWSGRDPEHRLHPLYLAGRYSKFARTTP